MPIESSPAFQFYVKEWRSSRAIMRMSFAQRGMYLEMLCEQWENLSLPDSPEEVAEIVGGSTYEWSRNWDVLRRKFVSNDDGTIYNLRLQKEREKQKSHSKRQSDRGKAGAAARWQKDGASISRPLPPDAKAMRGNGFPIPITTPIAIATTKPRHDGRSKRPIFTGQRLTVFEWMFDDLCRMLGTHTDAFGLDEWFYEADTLAAKEVAVVPDWWPWLKAKTLDEAKRRGLVVGTPKPTAEDADAKYRAETQAQADRVLALLQQERR